MALVSAIVLPLALLLYCWHAGLLTVPRAADNPDGHGLFSAINVYLLFVPLLNYVIFSYYAVYEEQISRLALDRSLVEERRSILGVLGTAMAGGLTLLGYAAAALLAFLSLRWSKKSAITNWLCVKGSPRPISYWFHFWFFGVQLSILFNWLLRHILVWTRLNQVLPGAKMDAYNPDQMFGLGVLSDLTLWSFIVVTVVSILVASWLVGVRVTLSKGSFFRNPGHIAAIVTLLIAGPSIVIFPLTAAHDSMLRAQQQELRSLAVQISRLAQEVKRVAAADGAVDATLVRSLSERLEAENRLYDFVKNCSVWPISRSTLTSLPVGFLSPVLVPLLAEAAKRVVRKVRLS